MSADSHAPAKKGSAVSGAWKAFGAVLGIGLAVVGIAYVIGALTSPFADGLSQIVIGLRAINAQLFNFQFESNQFFLLLVKIAILPVLLVLVLKNWVFKKADAHAAH